MSLDVIPEICEQIRLIPDKENEIDLLIVSQGGDPVVAWRIMGLLRERFNRVNVLVPFSAQSAATVLALGADSIVMHPNACLGPIDPQIMVPVPGQMGLNNTCFSVEDITSYTEFIEKDMGLNDEESRREAFEYLVDELKPTGIGLVKKGMKFSDTLAKKLLLLHMNQNECVENGGIDGIVDRFNNMTHHGYTIGRREVKESGLPVCIPDKNLECAMWNLWLDLESEMKFRTVFDPMKIMKSNQQVMSRFNESLKNGVPFREIIADITTIAMVESKYLSCHFDNDANIIVSGNGINTEFNVVASPCGWCRSNLQS